MEKVKSILKTAFEKIKNIFSIVKSNRHLQIILIAIVFVLILVIILLCFKGEDNIFNRENSTKDTVMATNLKWGVKKIETKDEKKYTVQQWNEGDYVVTNYYVLNPKYSDCHAYFSVKMVDYNIQKALTKLDNKDQYKKKYIDIKIGSMLFYDFESKQKEHKYVEKTHAGFFQKDKYIFEYKYQRYSSIDEKLLLELIQDVIDNIYIKG